MDYIKGAMEYVAKSVSAVTKNQPFVD